MSEAGGPRPARAPLDASALALVVIVNIEPGVAPPLERARAALRGGATMIQVRGKACGAGELARAAALLLPLCRGTGTPLFVDDRPDVALAAGADGVHLGPDDLPPAAARGVIGALGLGVSARTPERARAAREVGALYLGVGALRATASKPDTIVIGLEGIRAVAAATAIPVVAIGGILPGDAPALREAGARGVAVVSGVMGAEDPERAARAYREAWGRD